MIESGNLFCDRCTNQIVLEKPFTRVLIELVEPGTDRHYCEPCLREIYQLAETAPNESESLSCPQSPQDE